jgi:nicotinamidase-related amidase
MAAASAFHDTDLHDRLHQIGIRHLMITGIQTEYCVDGECRAAVGLGCQVTLLSMTTTHSTCRFSPPGQSLRTTLARRAAVSSRYRAPTR